MRPPHFARSLPPLTQLSLAQQDAAIKAHDEAFDKTAGKGSKIDLVLSIVRIALFHSDHELVISSLDRAKKCVSSSL